MSDVIDDAGVLNEQHLEYALAEQAKAAKDDLEMVEGEFYCEDCGRKLGKISKARFNAPTILCGECSDFYKKFDRPVKMRGGY